ncbi:hypothetical protein [Tahibacter harae]|uniref:DUF11 domain-containing protein n=1 Tax=Tahibacter harae TaxID=2963937 RepID=A0ABT1QZF3_9GAMM|nr:hypothetical protein [Tahibacter harae]MCQ4167674.1 hypothetical protein [Tahibacter harae]
MRATILAAWTAVAGLLCSAAMAGNPPASFTNPLAGDAPASIVVGGRINLNWAATASVCTYDGSSFPEGISFSEWPVAPTGGSTGQTVCNSAATCRELHDVSFTLPKTGVYHFVVTCFSIGGPAAVSSIDVLAVSPPTSDRVVLNLKASTAGPVRVGNTFDYELRLHNGGIHQLEAPSTELTLPAELSLVSGACVSANGNSLTWSMPNGLAPGVSASCPVRVRLNSLPPGESLEAGAVTRFTVSGARFSLATAEVVGTAHRARPLSLRRDGQATTENSTAPVLSGDGSLVAFTTRQRGLTDNDSNAGGSDIVLKSRRDGSTRLVSVRDSDGQALRGNSTSPALSANGRAIAFIYQPAASAAALAGQSAAPPDGRKAGEAGQLCNSPPNGLFRSTCTSTAPNGQPLQGPAESPSLSANGKLMAFCSSANNWVNGDTNNAKDVFVMDTVTRVVTLVSTMADGTPGDGDSCDATISGNGRYVVFRTRAPNLGGTANWQVVRKDLLSSRIERLSQTSSGRPANADVGRPSVSYDGQRVTFATRAPLLLSLVGGNNNVFLSVSGGSAAALRFDGGEAKEVAVPNDLGNGLFGVRGTSGGAPNGDAGDPSISCNGKVIAFGSSASDLVSGDIGGMTDVFVYDTEAEVTRSAVSTAGGAAPNGASGNPSLDCEGNAVAFDSTASNIDAADPNGNADIFAQQDPLNTGAVPARLDQSYSGNWFNPGQSGHGFLVEALPDGRFYLTWYLYLDGNPVFLQGVATPTGNVLEVPVYSVRSTGFPVGPGGGVASNWGRLRLTFTDSNTATVEWLPTGFGFTPGSMTLRRLTVPALAMDDPEGTPLRACYSGIWFEPARSGYGFNLEVVPQGPNGRTVVAYWYTYRPDGSPLWLIGQGQAGASAPTTMDLYEGGGVGAQFPFAFSSSALTLTKWGTASLTFTSDNTLNVSYQPQRAGYSAGNLSLVRLTELAGRRCTD